MLAYALYIGLLIDHGKREGWDAITIFAVYTLLAIFINVCGISYDLLSDKIHDL